MLIMGRFINCMNFINFISRNLVQKNHIIKSSHPSNQLLAQVDGSAVLKNMHNCTLQRSPKKPEIQDQVPVQNEDN